MGQPGNAALRDPAAAGYTDGDGQLGSGSSTLTIAGRYDRSGWRGVAVRTEEDGDPTVEIRYVRRDDIVVLVPLTHGGGNDAAAL